MSRGALSISFLEERRRQVLAHGHRQRRGVEGSGLRWCYPGNALLGVGRIGIVIIQYGTDERWLASITWIPLPDIIPVAADPLRPNLVSGEGIQDPVVRTRIERP